MERVRKHLKAHEEQPYDAEASQRQEEYYRVKETQFTIYRKFCNEMCKYAQQGIRHIHCKHCEWKTQKVCRCPLGALVSNSYPEIQT